MNKNEIKEKYGIASGQNREGKTPYKVEMVAKGFDLVASGHDYAGPTPQNLNKMLATEKAMNLAKSQGMSL